MNEALIVVAVQFIGAFIGIYLAVKLLEYLGRRKRK